MRWTSILSLVTAGAVLSCSSGSDEYVPPALACTTQKRPIVAVHGFLASGDTYAKQARRFAANGYCLMSMNAFDWNTLGEVTTEQNVALLDAFIDEVRQRAGVAKVDLMGHSAGGSLSYSYLSDPARAAKVAHYAHLGSFRQPDDKTEPRPAGPNGDVPTINVYSDGDLIVQDKGDIPGATNVRLTDADHYAVATGAETFDAVFRFFNEGQKPATNLYTSPARRPDLVLAGKVLALGSNRPESGASVEIHSLEDNGARIDGNIQSTKTDEEGRWGPLAFRRSQFSTYEVVVRTRDPSAPPVHYYFQPFVQSDLLLRLRTIPTDQSIAGSLLSTINYDDAHSVVIAFSANSGVTAGRDSLTVDGVELATEQFAPASKNAIAFFAYDANGNGTSENTPVSTFANFPFLAATDQFLDASAQTPLEVTLNGETIRVHRWRSSPEGPIVAVFND